MAWEQSMGWHVFLSHFYFKSVYWLFIVSRVNYGVSVYVSVMSHFGMSDDESDKSHFGVCCRSCVMHMIKCLDNYEVC
jgi:hypothetical protein